jgi:hypothetical protein
LGNERDNKPHDQCSAETGSLVQRRLDRAVGPALLPFLAIK